MYPSLQLAQPNALSTYTKPSLAACGTRPKAWGRKTHLCPKQLWQGLSETQAAQLGDKHIHYPPWIQVKFLLFTDVPVIVIR